VGQLMASVAGEAEIIVEGSLALSLGQSDRERACDLMHRESLTNAQLADRLDFCNEYHFSRIFKKRIGFSLGVFRGREQVERNAQDR